MIEKILNRKKQLEKENNKTIKIDSIMLYDNGKEESYFFETDKLHELRSVSKVFIALAYGIALDRKMKLSGGGI